MKRLTDRLGPGSGRARIAPQLDQPGVAFGDIGDHFFVVHATGEPSGGGVGEDRASNGEAFADRETGRNLDNRM